MQKAITEAASLPQSGNFSSAGLTSNDGEIHVPCEVQAPSKITQQVIHAIDELKAVQEPILSGEVDPAVLSDFRDAVNRVRNMAWAAQQSAAASFLEESPSNVASFLAAERVRAAYQLCRAILDDVRRDDLEIPKGSVLELYGTAAELLKQLKKGM